MSQNTNEKTIKVDSKNGKYKSLVFILGVLAIISTTIVGVKYMNLEAQRLQLEAELEQMKKDAEMRSRIVQIYEKHLTEVNVRLSDLIDRLEQKYGLQPTEGNNGKAK